MKRGFLNAKRIIGFGIRYGFTQLDMNCIERYFDGYGEVKRGWLRNLQQYYVFFYEKKGGKVRGVLGKDRTKDLIRAIL